MRQHIKDTKVGCMRKENVGASISYKPHFVVFVNFGDIFGDLFGAVFDPGAI